MSCETNGLKAKVAGLRVGISGLNNKAAAAGARIVTGLGRGAGRAAGMTMGLLESFDGPQTLDDLGPAALVAEVWGMLSRRTSGQASGDMIASATPPPEVGYTLGPSVNDADIPGWFTAGVEAKRAEAAAQAGRRFTTTGERQAAQGRQWRGRALLGLGLLKLGRTGSTAAGSGLARLSRTTDGPVEPRFFFPRSANLPVKVWSSHLTPLLNRLDAGPWPVQVSAGRMFELAGVTWHRGTVLVKTPQGERTLTHLQRLSLPACHYYFKRRLSDNETVGLIAGQKGFEPKSMAGYVGQISEVESLAPSWAAAKGQLIRAALLWDEPPGGTLNEEAAQADDRIEINGRSYPVIVTRIVGTPGRDPRAEAAYYDGTVWQEVRDSGLKKMLARRVEAGQLKLWSGKEHQDEL